MCFFISREGASGMRPREAVARPRPQRGQEKTVYGWKHHTL